MTYEEAIETIIRCRFQIRDSMELHIETLKHAERETAKALEALKQPPKATMTRAQAIEGQQRNSTNCTQALIESSRTTALFGERNSFAKALILPPSCAIS